MRAYYNERDAFAAAWLRELISDGLIAPGDVDERDIQQVRADDLRGYTQCHFFAGIGGWSAALCLAGWPDERPVWTGSCPCQPLSSAGQRKGHADQRHLWPAFHRLIAECRPAVVFGEQVAGALGYEWLAGIRADLEGDRYAVGAADLCAAGVGAPHIRQRLFWVADAGIARTGRDTGAAPGEEEGSRSARRADGLDSGDAPVADGADSRLANADKGQRGWVASGEGCEPDRQATGRIKGDGITQRGRIDHGLEHAPSDGRQQRRPEPGGLGVAGGCGYHWSRAEWLACSDGKARRVEPGIFPLAHGVRNRVGTLRGAGNAIVPQTAQVFIEAYMSLMP